MTTIQITGKVVKSGNRLYIHPDRCFYDQIRKLRGKALLVKITPVIVNDKNNKEESVIDH